MCGIKSSLLLFALAACWAVPASADDFSDCNAGTNLDRVVAACTRLIDDDGGHIDPSTFPNAPTMGLRAPQIAALQLYLSHKGYPAGGLDGVYGRATQSAVKKAKRDLGLSPRDLVLLSVRQLSLSIAFYNRGTAYLNTGDHRRAIADFDQSIQLNPGSVDAYANRGVAYADSGDLDRAVADYTQAIGLDPYLAEAYANRGLAYSAKGDTDRAIGDYDQAIKLDPEMAEAYINRGDAYLNKRDYDRAMADSKQAILLDPDLPEGYYNRGEASAGKEDFADALIYFRLVARLFPTANPWREKAQSRITDIETRMASARVSRLARSTAAESPTIFTAGGIVVMVSSAQVNEEPVTRISISGEIKPGDEKIFSDALLSVQDDPPIVFFNSSGGDLETGIAIGNMIRAEELMTAVVDHATCASACALAWLAGHPRFAEPGVSIGFNASTTAGTANPVRNAPADDYLNKLGFTSGAITYMTAMGPDEMRWLGPFDAMRLGIDYDEWGYAVEPVARVNAVRSDPPQPDSSIRSETP
jgi:tetratricopeptide (TPR) repeat protein